MDNLPILCDRSSVERVKRALQAYALDFAAAEAVRAALEQTRLELVLSDNEQDVRAWSEMDAISPTVRLAL